MMARIATAAAGDGTGSDGTHGDGGRGTGGPRARVRRRQPRVRGGKSLFRRGWLDEFDAGFDALLRASRETSIFDRRRPRAQAPETDADPVARLETGVVDEEELESIRLREKLMELQYKSVLHAAPEVLGSKAFHERKEF
jgi:hypothetical protein